MYLSSGSSDTVWPKVFLCIKISQFILIQLTAIIIDGPFKRIFVQAMYSRQQVSGTVNWHGTTLITFDMEVTCVIFDGNSVV